jgi:AcrR family transcriptional regulator
MSSKSKRDLALHKLYVHCAQHGFKGVDNVSFITKAMGISRSLFYFYFADTDDLLRALTAFHKSMIDGLYERAEDERRDFLTYIHNLLEQKDYYFFTLQAVRHAHEHANYREMAEHSLNTLDARNFREFVKHYELSTLSEASIRFMYESFRNFWFINSDYNNWNKERLDELIAQIDSTIQLLKTSEGKQGYTQGAGQG